MEQIIVLPVNESHLEECSKCEQTATEAWSLDQLAETLKSGCGKIFVALSFEKVVGVCVFQLAGSETSLNSITVLPQWRGKGVGKQLLAQAITALQKNGVDSFFLEVRSQNQSAISLYTSLGFKNVGLRKGFYKNPNDDAIVMSFIN